MNEFIRVSPKDARRFWSRVTKSPPLMGVGISTSTPRDTARCSG